MTRFLLWNMDKFWFIINVGVEESVEGRSTPNIFSFMKKEVEHKGNSVYNEVPTQYWEGIVKLYG